MADNLLLNFKNHSYLNLETFRKSGVGVQTPVWFVEDQGVLYVRTIDGSGKVKRIRRNGQVRVAPCDARGGLLGNWYAAEARLVSDQATIERVDRLLDRKYGLQRKLFNLFGRMQKAGPATIAIQLQGGELYRQ